jgi:NDP-sugar pyrophosphorylase family protein
MISTLARHDMNGYPVNIVVPMAGRGSRFDVAGYRDPKPLIDVFGKTMIEAVIENLTPRQPVQFIFVCQRQHYVEYDLESLFKRSLGTSWKCVQIDDVTEGAACTVLKAGQLIDNENSLIIANSDQLVDCDISAFLEHAESSRADGLIMTFPADDEKWSYASVDVSGFCTEVAEKRRISPHATVGIYHFASGRAFVHAAQAMIRKDIRINREFYVAPVYNELIQGGARIALWGIEGKAMHGLGTPDDLVAYFDSKGGYRSRSFPVGQG